MDFKKCVRCGCFFITNGEVCPSCMPKDTNDISKLNTFFSNNSSKLTVNELSSATGVSKKNISRYMTEKNFEYRKQINLD